MYFNWVKVGMYALLLLFLLVFIVAVFVVAAAFTCLCM